MSIPDSRQSPPIGIEGRPLTFCAGTSPVKPEGPTPETDAYEFVRYGTAGSERPRDVPEMRAFARSLERRLIAMTAERDTLIAIVNDQGDRLVARDFAHLDELRKPLIEERDAMTAIAGRLAAKGCHAHWCGLSGVYENEGGCKQCTCGWTEARNALREARRGK